MPGYLCSVCTCDLQLNEIKLPKDLTVMGPLMASSVSKEYTQLNF